MADEYVPSSEASLESMAFVIHQLRGVINTDLLAHLMGVQHFVRAKYKEDLANGRAQLRS